MITKLLLDTPPHGQMSTPVEFLYDIPGRTSINGTIEFVKVRLPDGSEVEIEARRVGSGFNSPEETLSVLAGESGLRAETLLQAAQSGRLMARKSGGTWLSTLNAIEYALLTRNLRSPVEK